MRDEGVAGCQANRGGQITFQRDPEGNTLEYDCSPGLFDQITRIKDKNGNVEIRTLYPDNQRLPDGVATTPWAKKGRLFRRWAVSLDGATNVLSEESHWNDDGTLHRRIERIDPNDVNRLKTTTYEYQAGTNGLNVSAILTAGGEPSRYCRSLCRVLTSSEGNHRSRGAGEEVAASHRSRDNFGIYL